MNRLEDVVHFEDDPTTRDIRLGIRKRDGSLGAEVKDPFPRGYAQQEKKEVRRSHGEVERSILSGDKGRNYTTDVEVIYLVS